MDNKKKTPASDAEWYFKQFEGEREAYYDVFFRMCKKFGVTWSKATEAERRFIEEITRYTFQCNEARRKGLSTESIAPVFELMQTETIT